MKCRLFLFKIINQSYLIDIYLLLFSIKPATGGAGMAHGIPCALALPGFARQSPGMLNCGQGQCGLVAR
jgi:hypothetical protein